MGLQRWLGLLVTVLLGTYGCTWITNEPPGDVDGQGGEAGSGTGGAPETGGVAAGGEAGSDGGGGTPTVEGDPCDEQDATACVSENQKVTLLCDQGFWQRVGVCSASENCDTKTGFCTELDEGCVERQPGAAFCTEEGDLRQCGPDRVTSELVLEQGCLTNLLDLQLSAGTLSPELNPTVFEYEILVSLFTQNVTLTPTGAPGSTLTIDGDSVDSGDEWISPVLDLGDNVLEIVVSREGHPDRSYTITITRGRQEAYVKASNTGVQDEFGNSVALSADGNTLAVGAPDEASSTLGIDGDESDNSASSSGAVYVFSRSGDSWTQEAYIKAANAGAGDTFGWSLALSADGDTLAVGAPYEADDSGAVYVFSRSDEWEPQAYVKASNAESNDDFGRSVALSADGDTLAVGAPDEDSSATGVGGDQTDNSAQYSGAAYVFSRSDGEWDQQAYVKASNPGANDWFGWSVALSADGDTLAVGASNEGGGDYGPGAAYVFSRSDDEWQQQAYVQASNAGAEDLFGCSVALSADGDTLAVGAAFEASSAAGIGGDQSDNSAWAAGAAYVFSRSDDEWEQQAYVKASNAGADDQFGWSVALSSSGDALAVGAPYEDSSARGIDGNGSNDSAPGAGAAYAFTRQGETWTQAAYVKASRAAGADTFGLSVALSGDGNTLAFGATGEDSRATGIGGLQTDNSSPSSGAVYVFR